MRIAIVWWQGSLGPKARWNVYAFESAGHEVEYKEDTTISDHIDMVFTPVPGLKFNKPLVTQFGGYGRTLCLPCSGFSRAAEESLETGDLVTILDPNMFLLMEKEGLDGETVTIPNGVPPITILHHNHTSFTVLYPSGDVVIKSPERFVEVARLVGEEQPDIKFVMPLRSRRVYRKPLDWLDVENLQLLPRQSHQNMLELYANADIICPFSTAEILPQTVFEGFLSGKPVIVDKIGLIQSIHRKCLPEMITWFGKPSKDFHLRWVNHYFSGEGEHYLHAESVEELAELILQLYTDEKRRVELGKNALEWIANFWKPADRGSCIVNVFKKRVSRKRS